MTSEQASDEIRFLRWTLTQVPGADDPHPLGSGWTYRSDLGEKFEIVLRDLRGGGPAARLDAPGIALWEARIRRKGEHRFEVTGIGPTLVDCEKSLLNALGLVRTDVDSLCIEVASPPTVHEAIANFVLDWGALPPLVRAGTAAAFMRDAYDGMRRHHETQPRLEEAGLTRRGLVHSLFQKADLAFYDLFVALTKEADDEAEAMGIDADTRYRDAPKVERPPEPAPASTEAELVRSVPEAVVDELHREVSDGLASISKKCGTCVHFREKGRLDAQSSWCGHPKAGSMDLVKRATQADDEPPPFCPGGEWPK